MKSVFISLFFAVYGVFFFFFYPYHLQFKEQLILFGGDILPYLQKPAAISEFLGNYLTQFYLLTGVGSLTLMGFLLLLWAGSFFAFKRTGIVRNITLLALLPVAAEAALSCFTEYPLSMVIGAVAAVWMFVALSYLKNKTVFSFALLVTAVALYLLTGAHFLLFLLFAFIEQIRRKVHWILLAATAIIALATPFIASRFYYLTVSQAYFYPIIEHYLLKQPFLFLLTEVSLLAAFLLNFWRIKKLFLYCIILIIAPLEVYLMSDFKEEYNLGLSSEAYFGNWNKVEALSKKEKYNTYISAYYGNLANVRKGKLAEELLKQYQPAEFGLFFKIRETDSYINLMAAPDVLMECGDMAQAQHSAMLAMIFTPHQRSSRMVRKLAEIAIANGEYPVAGKYLNMLSKTALHRRWANENRELIANDTTTFEFSGKRAFLSQRDTLFVSNDWRAALVNLLESNPQNRKAADYLLCYHLLRKDLKFFKADYDAYYYPAFGNSPPELYQEALLMLLNNEDEGQRRVESRKYRINQLVWNRSNNFLSLFENTQRNDGIIRSSFSTSYWFYYFYAQMK